MKALVQFSGGAASYIAAKLILEEFEPDDVTLLFADTKAEDADLYRFMDDAQRRLNVSITSLSDGRTPWEVFFDEKMIGNTRADPCSRILKRELLRKWMDETADPQDSVVVIGYDANESHRFEPLKERYKPWTVRAPLIERKIFKETALKMVERDGLKLPRLYSYGFAHNNCAGACIKGGRANGRCFSTISQKYMPSRNATKTSFVRSSVRTFQSSETEQAAQPSRLPCAS